MPQPPLRPHRIPSIVRLGFHVAHFSRYPIFDIACSLMNFRFQLSLPFRLFYNPEQSARDGVKRPNNSQDCTAYYISSIHLHHPSFRLLPYPVPLLSLLTPICIDITPLCGISLDQSKNTPSLLCSHLSFPVLIHQNPN